MNGGSGAVGIEIAVLGVLALVGLIIIARWLVGAYRPPIAAATDDGLRGQLLAARADISRQIEILQGGAHRLAPVIAGLQAQLKEIDQSLAELPEEDQDQDRPTLH